MIRNSIKGLPPLIDTEINLRKSKKKERAYKKALESYREFNEKIKQGALPSDILDRKLNVIKKSNEPELNILIWI